MVEYLHIPCPNCRHVLRVRKQYVGIEVTCTRCNHSFLVESPGDEVASKAPAPPVSHDECEKQIGQLKGEVERVRQEYASVVADNTRVAEQLQRLNEQYSQRETRVLELERSLVESQEVIRTSESLIKLESLDALIQPEDDNEAPSEVELSGLTHDVRKLRADRDRLAGAERTHAQTIEQLRTDLEQAKRALSEVTADRQRAEEQLRPELEASRQRWLAERQALEQQLADGRSQRQELEGQLDALKNITRDDGQLRNERDQLAGELEQERQRVKQLEDEVRSHAALTSLQQSPAEQAAVSPQANELNAQLQQTIAENERLRAVIRDLGIDL